MLNQLVLVGRLVKNIELKNEEGKNKINITLAVPRSFKNEEGFYDTDFIDIVLWNGIADNASNYCKKGDLLGVKGRIETRNILNKDGSSSKITEIVAEKITFLKNSKEGE